MAIVTRYTAQITNVNQALNQVGFVVKGDSQERQALVMTVPIAWRWPEVGETWLVKQENGTWYLDSVLPTNDYQDIQLGDAIINTPTGVTHVTGNPTGASDFVFAAHNIVPTPPHSSGQVLQTDGFGGTLWATGTGGGGVTVGPARAYRAGALTPAANTWTKIPLDTISYDPSGMVSTANGRMNIPVAGYYQVNASTLSNVSATGTYTNYATAIAKNGVQVSYSNIEAAVASGDGIPISDIVQCNAGDYLELWFYNSQATPLASSSTTTWMSVSYVGSVAGSTAPVTMARAYRTATLTATAAAWTLVPLDTTSYDPGSNFNTSTGKYTCPSTGYYQCSGTMIAGSSISGDGVIVGLAQNSTVPISRGGIGIQVANGGILSEGSVVSDVLHCNAGDTIALAYYAAAADAVFIGPSGTFLSVVQVGNSMNFTAAGGALTGTYPNPTLTQVTGSAWATPTLINSWVAGGGSTPQYLKDPLGFVHLRGSATTGTSGTTVFVLPAGYRPGVSDYYPILQSSGSAGAFLHIDTAGNVTATCGVSSQAWFTNITFLAEN